MVKEKVWVEGYGRGKLGKRGSVEKKGKFPDVKRAGWFDVGSILVPGSTLSVPLEKSTGKNFFVLMGGGGRGKGKDAQGGNG